MNHIPIHFPEWNLSRDNRDWGFGGLWRKGTRTERSNGSRGCDDDDDDDDDDGIMCSSSARMKAKGGDLFIGVTHVGDDAANSRTDFARRDLRFRRVFAKPRRERWIIAKHYGRFVQSLHANRAELNIKPTFSVFIAKYDYDFLRNDVTVGFTITVSSNPLQW